MTHIAGVEKVIKDESIIVRVKAPILTDSDGEPMREVMNSISPELIENVGEIVDGNVDYTTLGTDGVILNQFRIDRSNVPMDFSVGDKITFEDQYRGWRNRKRIFRKRNCLFSGCWAVLCIS